MCNRITVTGPHVDLTGSHGIFIERSSRCTVIGGQSNNSNSGDGVNITGAGAGNADYNVVVGIVCTGNADDGVAVEGGVDANKNVITSCQLLGNAGAALVDNGTLTETAHNIVV